jgi:serine/threonine-protein kinase RsbW
LPVIEELDACLALWGTDAAARYRARFAVEELGTNIIKYAYDDQAEHTIWLKAGDAPDVFQLYLPDDGHEFNPCQSPEPNPDLSLQDRKPGGWGLSLVRRLSAGLDYERRGDRNCVCVRVPRVSAS